MEKPLLPKYHLYYPVYCINERKCIGYKLASNFLSDASPKNAYFVHLGQVFEEIKRFADHPKPLPLMIKLPSRLLLEKSLAAQLSELLEGHEYDNSNLLLLIHEQSLSNPRVLKSTLPLLAKSGFHLGVDDFLGRLETGFSALESPFIRYLRISSEMTRSILTSEMARSYVRGTLLLADQLSKKVIFEGVDTEEVFNLLVKLGASLAHGNYFSKPVHFGK